MQQDARRHPRKTRQSFIAATRNQKTATQVVKLEEEKNALKESLELSQAEIVDLKKEAALTATKLAAASDKLSKVDELERRLIKQECHND